jgi:uncharacterized protein (TIGR03435 family)
MVWWIGSRLIAEREHACDEHVVGETAEPIAYAEGIVTICRRYVETPLMSVSGVGGADVKARIDSILANRIGVRLTVARRIVLTAASTMALAVPLVTGAIDAAAPSAGQVPGLTPAGPPVDPEIRFEVASIKPFDPSAPLRLSTPPGRYEAAGLPLPLVFAQAFAVPVDRIIGLPDWVNTERYAITAKAPDGVRVAFTPGRVSAMTVMLANLLKDRFKLATHRETRELPVYNLVFARNDKRFGPAFKETSPECRAMISARLEAAQRGGPAPAVPPDPNGCLSPGMGPGIASFKGAPMATIANVILAQQVGRPVIDKTGLTGLYDFTLKWTPQPGSGGLTPFGLPAGGPPDAAPPADPDAPGLFTAVQEQLGFRLESARGPVEVVVIDRLEKPTPD